MTHNAEYDAPSEAVKFINSLINAWDCCGTCAGGVLAVRERRVAERAWDEGRNARPQYLGPDDGHYNDECMGWEDCHCGTYSNPYRVIPPGLDGGAS